MKSSTELKCGHISKNPAKLGPSVFLGIISVNRSRFWLFGAPFQLFEALLLWRRVSNLALWGPLLSYWGPYPLKSGPLLNFWGPHFSSQGASFIILGPLSSVRDPPFNHVESHTKVMGAPLILLGPKSPVIGPFT